MDIVVAWLIVIASMITLIVMAAKYISERFFFNLPPGFRMMKVGDEFAYCNRKGEKSLLIRRPDQAVHLAWVEYEQTEFPAVQYVPVQELWRA